MSATGPMFQSVTVFPTLVPERGEAAIAVVSEFAAGWGGPVLLRTEILQSELPVTSTEDSITALRSETSVVQSGVIPRVSLWWPNGRGRQMLYTARVSLLDAEDHLLDQRTVRFGVRQVEAEYTPCSPARGPLLRLRVSGREVEVRGAVWRRRTDEPRGEHEARTARVLRLAQRAGVNLLRVQGDDLECPQFYDLCDEYGILVWQNFPNGLRDRERAEDVVAALRAHPSLALWSAGETETGPEPEVAVLLRETVALEDPDRGWVEARPVAAPREQDLLAPFLTRAFGPELSPGDAARAGELLHALEIQERAEEGRRTGAPEPLPAWLNGPAPEYGLVDDLGRPRLGYYLIKRAWAPFHVSAQSLAADWTRESAFRADIWLHNDGADRSLLNVVASITDLHGRELYQENLAGEAPSDRAENVGDLHWRFPAGFAEAFLLFLEVVDEEGDVIARNAYPHSRAPAPACSPFLTAPETTLAVERDGDAVTVRNRGTAVALCVELHGPDALISESGFMLAPGEARAVTVQGAGSDLTAAAWNAPPRRAD